MADQKVSNLPALNGADVDSADLLYIIDSSAGTAGSKKITIGQYQLAPVSGGTANGVTYLNGSKVQTSGSALTFDGTNLGIGTSSPGAKLNIATGNTGTTIRSTPAIIIQSNATNSDTNLRFSDGVTYASEVGQQNGGLYFTTSGLERARLDSSGNLGLGVTPSAWNSDYKPMQLGINGSVYGRVATLSNVGISANAFRNSGGSWQYISTSQASRYDQDGSNHYWYTAPSGTAGNAITFTQAMTLDASGNLGIGTTSPAQRLDVRGAENGVHARFGSVSNRGLEISTQIVSGTTDAGCVLNARGAAAGTLIFQTESTERARITSGGDLLVGSASQVSAERLLVSKTGSDATIRVSNNTTGDAVLILAAEGLDSGNLWFERSTSRLYARNSGSGGVYLASNATSWTAVSDERLKTALTPIADAATKVSSLRAVTGRYKTDADDVSRSFLIAQDVQAVFPEAVNADDPDELGLSYTDMVPLLVAAIKEQQTIITDLRARVAALEAK
jgi:hypothetical protein